MVCNRVVGHVKVSASDRYTRSLIIDYTGCPILFEAQGLKDAFECTRPTFMSAIPPMGEADVKFLRWAEHFKGDMVAFSVDGDFIPIALMHYEERVHALSEHQKLNLSTPPPHLLNVCIYRIKCKTAAQQQLQQQGVRVKAAAATTKPRKFNDVNQRLLTCASSGEAGQKVVVGLSKPPAQEEASSSSVSSKKTEESGEKSGASRLREFEYVNIPKLYLAMRKVFSGFCPSYKRSPLHPHHYMRMLAMLIGLSGTDFTRGLPYIGPGTLWGMMPERSIFTSLLHCYDASTGVINTRDACSALACNIYMHKFSSHFKKAAAATSSLAVGSDDDGDEDDDNSACSGAFRDMLAVLKMSQLSEKTRYVLCFCSHKRQNKLSE